MKIHVPPHRLPGQEVSASHTRGWSLREGRHRHPNRAPAHAGFGPGVQTEITSLGEPPATAFLAWVFVDHMVSATGVQPVFGAPARRCMGRAPSGGFDPLGLVGYRRGSCSGLWTRGDTGHGPVRRQSSCSRFLTLALCRHPVHHRGSRSAQRRFGPLKPGRSSLGPRWSEGPMVRAPMGPSALGRDRARSLACAPGRPRSR